MYNLDLTRGNYPIIIKPNLGQPILINLRDFKDTSGIFTEKVNFEAIIITIPNQSIQEILEYFHLNIYIQPILRDDGSFSERRGKRFPIQLLKVKKIEKIDFRESSILDEKKCISWDLYKNLLQVEDVFGERKDLYRIKFHIKNIKSINTLIKDSGKSFLLFDIVHDLPNNMEDKVNYHSIALFDKDWGDFKFIHMTDFHIARRNDFILHFIKEKVKKRYKQNKKKKKHLSKTDKFTLTRDFEYKKGFQEHKLEDLRHAKYNFNYNLRLGINFINEEVQKKELDFVIMTGDFIDFFKIAMGNYQYKNNFYVFFNILLGLNKGLNKPPFFADNEFINKKEILAPIFTTVGNHDYRKGHYSIKFKIARKIFGLKYEDLLGYHDMSIFKPFGAISSKNKNLRDYFRYINPNLNYKIKIGNNYNFIFLDTGQDSIADMHDLMKANPSTKGLKEYQIDLLRNYIQLCHDGKIIIVMHTPPISPNLTKKKKKEIKKNIKY